MSSSLAVRRLSVPAGAPANGSELQPRWRGALRRQLELAAALTGGVWLMFSLNALSTLGQITRDFWLFSATLFAGWFITVLMQLVTLQWLHPLPRRRRLWMLLRFAAVLLAGLAIQQGAATVAASYSDRLGLTLPGQSSPHVANWFAMWLALFLVLRDEGLYRQSLALERLQRLQAAQIASRRRLVESQLRALQARVDPQLFFDLLDAVERLYPVDAARAEALFDELIVFLRAALPRLHSASSCLRQELVLVQSYLRARSLAGDDAATLSIEIGADVQELAFPAGVLLPLMIGIAPALPASARLALVAGVAAARPSAAQAPCRYLELTLSAPAAMPQTLVASLAQTLHALHGDAAHLRCIHAGGDCFHHTLSVPLETD